MIGSDTNSPSESKFSYKVKSESKHLEIPVKSVDGFISTLVSNTKQSYESFLASASSKGFSSSALIKDFTLKLISFSLTNLIKHLKRNIILPTSCI